MYRNYILVNEDRPNSFNPIYWTENNNLYNIKMIDYFTKNFSEEELINFFKDKKLVDKENINLQIIFNDNGIRRVKEGLIYKDNYTNDMLKFVKDYVNNIKHDTQLLNELYQKFYNNKLCDDLTKGILKVLFDNRHLKDDEIIIIINELDNCVYDDIRMMYFYIINKPKLDNNKIKVLKNNI